MSFFFFLINISSSQKQKKKKNSNTSFTSNTTSSSILLSIHLVGCLANNFGKMLCVLVRPSVCLSTILCIYLQYVRRRIFTIIKWVLLTVTCLLCGWFYLVFFAFSFPFVSFSFLFLFCLFGFSFISVYLIIFCMWTALLFKTFMS